MDGTGFASPHRLILHNGPEFVARAVRGWLAELGVTTLFIEPGSPWENGYVESFNGKLRDELRRRALLHPQGGTDPDRAVATSVQPPAPAQLPRPTSAGAGDDRLDGVLAQGLRTPGSHARGGSGTIIDTGPTNGVRSPWIWPLQEAHDVRVTALVEESHE